MTWNYVPLNAKEDCGTGGDLKCDSLSSSVHDIFKPQMNLTPLNVCQQKKHGQNSKEWSWIV